MNRFVSLLPAALCLAAVSLAQPAQAQWVKGQAYYGQENTFSHDANTTSSTTGVGDITLTSISPGGRYSSINTAGSYNASFIQPYTWTGAPNSPGSGFVYSDTYAVSGSCTGAGSASSNVGGGFHGTTTDPLTPGNYSKQGGSGPATFVNANNVTTVNFQVSIGVGTTASNGGVATGNANITFSAPS